MRPDSALLTDGKLPPNQSTPRANLLYWPVAEGMAGQCPGIKLT